LIARFGTSHVTISLMVVRHTPRVKVPGNEEAENS